MTNPSPQPNAVDNAPSIKPKNITIARVNDVGTSFLVVENFLIAQLGIARSISTFSAMTPKTSFLRAPLDSELFMKAAEKAGWSIELADRFVNGLAPPRRYATFQPDWIEEPLRVGSLARLLDGRICEVSEMGKNQVVFQALDGQEVKASPTIAIGMIRSESRHWEVHASKAVARSRAQGPTP